MIHHPAAARQAFSTLVELVSGVDVQPSVIIADRKPTATPSSDIASTIITTITQTTLAAEEDIPSTDILYIVSVGEFSSSTTTTTIMQTTLTAEEDVPSNDVPYIVSVGEFSSSTSSATTPSTVPAVTKPAFTKSFAPTSATDLSSLETNIPNKDSEKLVHLLLISYFRGLIHSVGT